MKHGEFPACKFCVSSRLSVVEMAAQTVVDSQVGSREHNLASRLLEFLCTYGTMQTVIEQNDLVSRVGGDPTAIRENKEQTAERLRAMYMAFTSKCVHEFRNDKCIKVETD